MSDHVWCICPVVNGRDLTIAALSDLLHQTVPTKVLVVGQGWDPDLRQEIEQIAEENPERIFVWSHTPPLPSLSATWNRALRFVWEAGGTEALVTNHDVRLHRQTCEYLHRISEREDALFVSALGVQAEQFDPQKEYTDYDFWDAHSDGEKAGYLLQRGGPDFSCFHITQTGHEAYPFDEAFVPAVCEDLDCHRRYMLGGDGARIFSVNLPFHHIGGGSQTLKAMDAEKKAAWEARINQGSRTHYRAKWGGDVNAERFTVPFDYRSDQDGVTTPDLQRMIQAGQPVDVVKPTPQVLVVD